MNSIHLPWESSPPQGASRLQNEANKTYSLLHVTRCHGKATLTKRIYGTVGFKEITTPVNLEEKGKCHRQSQSPTKFTFACETNNVGPNIFEQSRLIPGFNGWYWHWNSPESSKFSPRMSWRLASFAKWNTFDSKLFINRQIGRHFNIWGTNEKELESHD